MKTETISIHLNGVDVINGWESNVPVDLVRCEIAFENLSIKTLVENNGIGAYEYWGARGYDAGTDYVVIDTAESIVVSVHLHDIPTQDLSELVKHAEEALYMQRDISHSVGDYDESISAEAHTTFNLLYAHVVDEDAVIIFDVQWELS